MRGGTQLSLISRKSPFSHIRSDWREISVSGHSSKEQGDEILKALLSEPLKNGGIGSTLHIHLANYQPIEGGESNTIAPQEEKSDLNLFELFETQATMDDLILPDELKERILRNLIIIKHRHILFDTWGLKDVTGFKNKVAVSLNLIGSPGTGKTFAAEAIAKKLNKSLMVVNYAMLV